MRTLILALLLACPLRPAHAGALASSSAWSVTGSAGAYLGESLAGVGDVTGSGYSDVLVGAYGAAGSLGAVYLFPGGPAGLATGASWSLTGTALLGAGLGTVVAAAGDLNHDGYADFVVTSKGPVGTSGAAYLFLGGPSGPSAAPAWSATGAAGSGFAASVVSGAFSNSGYRDLAVASVASGSVALYPGTAGGLSATAAWSNTAGANVVVGGGQDNNHDGYDDLIVGAPSSGPNGQVWVFLGGPSGLPATPSWVLDGSAVGSLGSQFGSSVAGAGDVNGDGYADLLVGDQSSAGTVRLFLGGLGGPASTPAWTQSGPSAGAGFGVHLAGTGDLNADGYADVYIGANSGFADVFTGGPGGLGSLPAWSASGPGAYGYVGAGAGDINGSGHSDLIVSAYQASGHEGEAYLYLGLPIQASPTATGGGSGPATGSSRVYPSPVRGGTVHVALNLASATDAHLRIYNEAGDLACSVDQPGLAAGPQVLDVDASRFARGAYFYVCTLVSPGGGTQVLPTGKFLVVH